MLLLLNTHFSLSARNFQCSFAAWHLLTDAMSSHIFSVWIELLFVGVCVSALVVIIRLVIVNQNENLFKTLIWMSLVIFRFVEPPVGMRPRLMRLDLYDIFFFIFCGYCNVLVRLYLVCDAIDVVRCCILTRWSIRTSVQSELKPNEGGE